MRVLNCRVPWRCKSQGAGHVFAPLRRPSEVLCTPTAHRNVEDCCLSAQCARTSIIHNTSAGWKLSGVLTNSRTRTCQAVLLTPTSSRSVIPNLNVTLRLRRRDRGKNLPSGADLDRVVRLCLRQQFRAVTKSLHNLVVQLWRPVESTIWGRAY